MKEIADIKVNFGLRFENHNYTREHLLKIKEEIEKEYNLKLSSSYDTTLVGNFDADNLDNFIYFYQNILRRISKKYHIDVEVYFEKNNKLSILGGEQ